MLAANLNALMAARPDLSSSDAVAQRSGVGKTNVHRMRKATNAAQIDTVGAVASAFRLRACDLLDPGLAARVIKEESLRMSEARPPEIDVQTWARTPSMLRALVEDLVTLSTDGRLRDDTLVALHQVLRVSTPPAEKPLGAPIAPEHEAALREQQDHAEKQHGRRRPPGRVSNS